jgi:ankyrin repeat protein
MYPPLQLDFVFANATSHMMVQSLGECALKWGERVFFPEYVIGDPPRSIQRTIHEANLWEACSRGDVDKVRQLCEIGTTLDMESSDGDSLLHHAIRKGHVSVVRELLSLGAPVDSGSANMGNYDAVAAAIRSRNPEIVRTLLDAKVPYNEEHALRLAIRCFDAELISLVLPDPNKRFSGGRTALHLAVELRLLEPATQLLELGISICRDDAGVTPRDIVEDHGYSDLLKLFRNLCK